MNPLKCTFCPVWCSIVTTDEYITSTSLLASDHCGRKKRRPWWDHLKHLTFYIYDGIQVGPFGVKGHLVCRFSLFNIAVCYFLFSAMELQTINMNTFFRNQETFHNYSPFLRQTEDQWNHHKSLIQPNSIIKTHILC